MMARRVQHRGHEEGRSSTCELLLRKLRDGQEQLRGSIRVLKEPSLCGTGGRLAVHRDSAWKSPTACVRNLPMKRARTVLLSPEPSPVGSPSTSPMPRTRPAKLPRRLSSTPKVLSDLSLEEAVLADPPATEGEGLKEELDLARKARPRLSQVDISSSRATPGSKPKQRGLTVSFVRDDQAHVTDRDQETGGTELSYQAKKDMGTSLIQSLNSSRFGALDRSYSQLRKSHTFPRKYRGDDPRLGYDWIAGLLDSDSYLAEHDEEYFEEMREFRRVNNSECCMPKEALLPGTPPPAKESSETGPGQGGGRIMDHSVTCVRSYVLNDRLFPVPVHQSASGLDLPCPVCEGKDKRDPSPTRYVRVSVPRISLQAPYRLRSHQQREFGTTDTMGLSQSGWENAKPFIFPPHRSVDLKSALEHPVTATTQDKEPTTAERTHSQYLLNTTRSMDYTQRKRPK